MENFIDKNPNHDASELDIEITPISKKEVDDFKEIGRASCRERV